MTKPKPTKYVFVEVSGVKGELMQETVEYKLPIDKMEIISEISKYLQKYELNYYGYKEKNL